MSTQREDMPGLGPSGRDDLALVVRAAAAAVPFWGGLLGEIFTGIVSDRQERVEEYSRRLLDDLQTLKVDFDRLRQRDNRNLLEEGARASVQQTNAVRIKYIAACVAHGISEEVRTKLQSARLVRIVSELDEEEIVFLAALQRGLPPVAQDAATREMLLARLERLNLVRFRPHMTRAELPQAIGQVREEIITPEYDAFGHRKGDFEITQLGTEVLSSIHAA